MDDPRATLSEPRECLGQKLVADTPDTALFTLDAAGAISSWDSGARALTGFPEEEILGRPLAQLAVATTLDSQWTDPLPLVRKEGWLDLETLWLHRDGTPLWVALSLSALEDPTGEAAGYAVLARLLAGHRQREAALLTRESLFQTFLERNVVGIVVADGAGRHRQANEAAAT
ncbi:MAG: PAS domain-containing protein, partial [Myxococcota bacterium]